LRAENVAPTLRSAPQARLERGCPHPRLMRIPPS
jgi:hypothetical protein